MTQSEGSLRLNAKLKNSEPKSLMEKCPVNEGDVVQVNYDGREFSFVVELATYHLDMDPMTGELPGAVAGAETGWAASGPKMRKSDGEPGKHRYCINGAEFSLEHDRWVSQPKGIEEALGIGKLNET
ncbi:hypothetical protein [Sulfitobacter dubius]|uniref:hypothetical protein n=1 Tax=Sulfitobacter dubius TaxID=218673 RepID=UPI000B86A15D|nr:hypothetical protein [Sulfitobacter dubius]